jgi:hypothetical protein
VLGGVSVIFLYLHLGTGRLLHRRLAMWTTMNSFTLIAIPLFILMAMLLERSGVAQNLYRMMHLWWGGVRGGLAIGTVVICAIFAAMCGISAPPVVIDGHDRAAQYAQARLRQGTGARRHQRGRRLGHPDPALDPHGALFADHRVSVGQLFAAGIVPGILLLVLVSLYIGIRCWWQPHLGPALPPEERGTMREKLRALRAVLLPIMIVFMVLGSIFGGLATPTEAAAIGVLRRHGRRGVQRQAVNWAMLREAACAPSAHRHGDVDPVRRARLLDRLQRAGRAELHRRHDGLRAGRRLGRADRLHDHHASCWAWCSTRWASC